MSGAIPQLPPCPHGVLRTDLPLQGYFYVYQHSSYAGTKNIKRDKAIYGLQNDDHNSGYQTKDSRLELKNAARLHDILLRTSRYLQHFIRPVYA